MTVRYYEAVKYFRMVGVAIKSVKASNSNKFAVKPVEKSVYVCELQTPVVWWSC